MNWVTLYFDAIREILSQFFISYQLRGKGLMRYEIRDTKFLRQAQDERGVGIGQVGGLHFAHPPLTRLDSRSELAPYSIRGRE